MENKLWYKQAFKGEIVNHLINLRNYIQGLIDLYCPELFKVPEDITHNNLQQFLEITLKNYQYYNLNNSNLMDLGEALEYYFSRTYKNEFSNTSYLNYSSNDRRALALHILRHCIEYTSWVLLPEDVPFLLKCLNVPDDQIVHMEEKLDNYFKQFDFEKRCNVEIPKRWEVITMQRKEALEKGEPLPIRPMGVELDMCYKG